MHPRVDLFFDDYCNEFCYKPGSRLMWDRDPFSGIIRFTVAMRVMDVENQPHHTMIQRTVPLHGVETLGLDQLRSALDDIIHCSIVDMETHEVDEWLRFYGERHREPKHS